MTSQPIRLSTNVMTLIPSLTFTDYEWFPWSICNGCGMPAGNAYPSGHLVPSPILGLANAPIVETKFLELAMSLLDFSPRIALGTFLILPFTSMALWIYIFQIKVNGSHFPVRVFGFYSGCVSFKYGPPLCWGTLRIPSTPVRARGGLSWECVLRIASVIVKGD